MEHTCLTTINHLHVIADRHGKPVVEWGEFYAVVVEKPGRDPIAYVAPKAEAGELRVSA